MGSTPPKEKTKMIQTKTLKIQEDPLTGDLFIELPEDILQAVDLKEGDDIVWEPVGAGDKSWTLRKKYASLMDAAEQPST